MGATTYVNLIIPEVWNKYIPAKIPEVAKLLGSAAVQRDENPPFKSGGIYNYRPFVKEFTSSLEIPSPATNLTINSLSTDKDTLVCLHRAIAIGEESNAIRRAGESVLQDFLNQQTEYIAKQVEDRMLYVLKGVFESALAGTHQLDASSATIDVQKIFNAKYKIGDNSDALTTIVMHSKVFQDLALNGLVQYVNASDLGKNIAVTGRIPTIAGMQIVVSDRMTKDSNGVYHTYLLGENSLYYGLAYFNVTVGHDNLLAGGTDYAVFNIDFAVHVPGVKFALSGVTNPTDAQLQLGTTWEKVADHDKDIHVVEILTV